MKAIVLIIFISLSCTEKISKNKFCDPASESFKFELLLRLARQDNSAYCFFNARTFGNSVNSDGIRTGLPTVATPIFTPIPAHYNTPQTITITTSTPDAKIYFTIDGTTPTGSSILYTTGFHIWSAAGKNIQAIAIKSGMTDSAVASGRFSYPPLSTRQTICYDNLNNIIACSGAVAGQDAKENRGVAVTYTGPTAHATFTNDFTTTDNATGLVWRSCSIGQNTATCTGTSTMQSFALHTTACANLNSLNSGSGYAGKTNWRLPTMKELTSLTSFNESAIEVNPTAFPTTINFAYWSSTPTLFVSFGTDRWYLDYTGPANSYITNSTNGYHARCVSAPIFPETRSFTDNGDFTIKDNTTGLIWAKCPVADPTCGGVGGNATSWIAALNDCSTSTVAGKIWRLPNQNELSTLYEFSKATPPFIDLTYFPNTFGGLFWTSTTFSGNATEAYYVNFGPSNVFSNAQPKSNNTTPVRCVTGP